MWLHFWRDVSRWDVASCRCLFWWGSQTNRAVTESLAELKLLAGVQEAAFHLSNAEGGGGDNYLGRGIKKESSASENPQRRGDQQMFGSGKGQEDVSVVAVTLEYSLPIFQSCVR